MTVAGPRDVITRPSPTAAPPPTPPPAGAGSAAKQAERPGRALLRHRPAPRFAACQGIKAEPFEEVWAVNREAVLEMRLLFWADQQGGWKIFGCSSGLLLPDGSVLRPAERR